MNILENEHIFDGQFGLERETLRVDENGFLADTPHPFPGDARLDRDFCENQLELITPVCGSIDELMGVLAALDEEVRRTLFKQGEYLWMNSNPPRIRTEDDIPVARFSGAQSFKHDYRVNLEKRYGKRLMLFSGIHFNFSFTEELLSELCPARDDETVLYFKLHKYLCRYGWLLVLLTAASPVYDLSLDGDHLTGDGFDGYASKRCGDRGYWNKFLPILDYSDISAYAAGIEKYIDSGALFSAAELYLPVRMKPRGENDLQSLVKNGIDHIELRMFDLNPLFPLGISPDDLRFAHCFIIYLISLPDFEFTPELQKAAIENHKAAARFEPENINGYPAFSAAMGLLEDMSLFFSGTRAERVIELQLEKLKNDTRWCREVKRRFGRDFKGKMLELAKRGKS